MYELDDRSLVALCIEGDDLAIAELRRRYGPLVLAVVRRILLAELRPFLDIVVDEAWDNVFFKGLQSWRGECSLKTYVATIAAHCAIDANRRLGGRPGPDQVKDIGTIRDPMKELITEEQMECIRKAAMGCGDAVRIHLELWLREASTEEIAKELGIGERAVQLQWGRMIECFQRALKRAEHPRLEI